MQTRQFIGAAAVALCLAVPAAHAAQEFTLDPGHSSVGFKVGHMMVSTVRGAFQAFEGTVHFDPKNAANSRVDVTIDTASLTTHNEKRDNHLKSPDFFDVENFPTITFKSTRVEKKGDQWIVTGDLTIRDVTKSVELPFTLGGPAKNPWGNQVIGIQATTRINRTDFGLNWNKALEAGGVLADETVEIEISAEATRAAS
jgi:polyisoprenoid-binding protein YceI